MAQLDHKNEDARPAGEVVHVGTRRVACDGDGGALGHPRVYLEMGDKDEVECPYCDRLFVYRASHP